jgi:hypothetical protein
MLQYIGDQSERLTGGLVGAMLGVIFATPLSPASFGGAVAFLLSFFVLFCTQGLPRYFAKQPNGALRAVLVFIIFVIIWVVATIYFSNMYILKEGWTPNDADLRVLLLFGILLMASVVSVISALL